jgi:hypothetical protein
MTLGEWLTYSSLRASGKQFGQAYSDYRSQREDWDRRIRELNEQIYRCGDCPERQQLESELQTVQSEKTRFVALAKGVLGSIGPGNSAYASAWSRILGLDSGPSAEARRLDQEAQKGRAEDVKRMRASNADPVCIDLFLAYDRCMVQNDETGAHCRNEHELSEVCQHDRSKLEERIVLFERRRQGEVMPEMRELFDGQVIEVRYGDVPAGFSPELPSLDVLGGRVLQMYMNRPKGTNLIENVQILPVNTLALQSADIGMFDINWDDPAFKRITEADRILLCEYNSSGGGLEVVKFWYERGPDLPSNAELKAGSSKHPLAQMGGTQNACPLERRDALTLWENGQG